MTTDEAKLKKRRKYHRQYYHWKKREEKRKQLSMDDAGYKSISSAREGSKTMTTHNKVKVSIKKSYEVGKAIENNGHMEDGMWLYSDGWNDQRVAKEQGVALNVVARRRIEIFGPTLAVSNSSGGRITALEAEITKLKTELAATQAQLAGNGSQFEIYDKAIDMLLTGLARGRNSVDQRKLDELCHFFNSARHVPNPNNLAR